jgi:hypothetical protein
MLISALKASPNDKSLKLVFKCLQKSVLAWCVTRKVTGKIKLWNISKRRRLSPELLTRDRIFSYTVALRTT